jgi:hypothetical protein
LDLGTALWLLESCRFWKNPCFAALERYLGFGYGPVAFGIISFMEKPLLRGLGKASWIGYGPVAFGIMSFLEKNPAWRPWKGILDLGTALWLLESCGLSKHLCLVACGLLAIANHM